MGLINSTKRRDNGVGGVQVGPSSQHPNRRESIVSSGSGSSEVAMLTKYSNLNGLYPVCSWDSKIIKKMILEKKVAPLFPGQELKSNREMDECPICFLYYYGGLNRTKCCKKEICTECFFQVKKPNVTLEQSVCPFCNRTKFNATYNGPKTELERQKEEKEDQKVLDLQKKMRDEEIERDKKREMEKKQKEEAASIIIKGKEKEVKDTVKNPSLIPSGSGSSSREKGKEAKGYSKSDLTRITGSGPKTTLGDGTNSIPKKKSSKHKTSKTHDENSLENDSDHPNSSSSIRNSSGKSKVLDINSNISTDANGNQNEGGSGSVVVRQGASPEQDLEELMILEAIRLSLIDGKSGNGDSKARDDDSDSDEEDSEEGDDEEDTTKKGGTEGSSSVGDNRLELLFAGGSDEELVDGVNNSGPRGRRSNSEAKTPPMQRVNIADTPLGSSVENHSIEDDIELI